MTPEEIEQIHAINATVRFDQYPKCEEKEYRELHTSLAMPTNIKIDVENFRNTMKQYHKFFKTWSNNRPEMLEIRKGLPLVNLTGNYDDVEDITIGPLDYYNKNNPNRRYNETDIVTPTAILDDPCFWPLHILKPYLIRSSILMWREGANFVPHRDLATPTPHFRLWGTDNPEVIKLRFENYNKELVEVPDIEPGRLYIIDTAVTHDAYCVSDIGYQFFIAVNSFAYDLLTEIKL
jgi:hypothetical protein